MSRATLLLLVLLVGGLAALVSLQVRREHREEADREVPLFEGVDRTRVTRFMIENLERDQHLAFVRDERGRWQMVEPMEIAADQTIVQHLFDLLVDRRATTDVQSGATPKDLHLEPPRAILEMEVEPGGPAHRKRVDLGSIDIDGAHVHVRANGRLLRTWRDIDTMLDRPLEDYMSHDILDLPEREVVEIHRRGRLVRTSGEAASDLTLDALLEDGSWRATAPVEGLLAREAMHLYVQALLGMRASGYADFGKKLLRDLGLDPPEMTITISTVSARTEVVRFGRPGHAIGSPWYCSVDGKPHVWVVDSPLVEYFDSAVEILMDPSLSRLPVDEVDAFTLALEGRELRLWREKISAPPGTEWRVSGRAGPETAYTPGLQADAGRVEDLLAKISHVQIARFLPGESLGESEIRGTILLQAGDERAGGSLGGDAGSEEKGRAVRYQRSGDTIAGLVDPEILDLLRTTASDLLSLFVADLPEIEQTGLEISGKGVQRRFVRGAKGLWTPPEVPIEARELRPVLDSLTILRATKHCGEGPQPALADPITVEFENLSGAKATYTIGLVPDAAEGERTQVEREGRRSVLKDQGLHERLVAVLAAR